MKQAHRDKVSEVKNVREEEAARYRRELETQLDKVRRDMLETRSKTWKGV